MPIGVIDQVTMGEQHRRWILGLFYSASGKTQLFFNFYSLQLPNYRLRNISIIVFAPLQLSSQKLLKYKHTGEAFTTLAPSTCSYAYADDS